MNRISFTGLPHLSAAAICWLGMVMPVIAAPPTSRLDSPTRQSAARGLFGSRNPETGAGSPAPQALPAHLDLRPPSAGELSLLSAASDASLRAAVAASETPRFPSFRRQQASARDSADNALPGFEAPQAHPVGMAQGIAERFGHEGLPVARLWENHAALVSLGLNQKGKPGLWLMQKTH